MEVGHETNTTMHDDDRRSASPTPPPPVETTPGPRATALQRLYADATAHILKTCSYNNFASCFPTTASAVPWSVQDLHSQFTTALGASMRANFDDILVERDVVRSLNELDRLVSEAKKRRAQARARAGDMADRVQSPTPPHTMPARELYLSHLAPSLTQTSETLTARQETLANDNVEMLERVMTQRRYIKELMSGLEGAVSELSEAAACLSQEEIERLRDENRDVNEGMRDGV